MSGNSGSNKEDWKNKLTPDQYEICRLGGTERPFSGDLLDKKEPGTYACVCCDHELFSSDTKFESGTGWPSFYDVMKSQNVKCISDHKFGMVRIEVQCANCDAHLGHVFDDGPKPTGKRYCINSAALKFIPR